MTTDFTHGYLPPGVYINEEPTTLVNITGIPPTLLAIVGPSQGYRVHTEQMPLSDDGITLAKQGIDLTSVKVTLVDTGETLAGSEYAATKIGSASDQSYFSDLSRDEDAENDDGTLVFVTYHYTPPEYFAPKRFENFEDVKDAYGEPVNFAAQALGDTSYQPILSPLTLAAQIAFANGAPELVLCATTPPGTGDTTDNQKSTARKAALVAAYNKIGTTYDVSVVVPLTNGIVSGDAPGVASDLKNHLENASQDGFYRTGVVGFDLGVTTAPNTLISTGNLASKRLILAYAGPGGLNFYAGGANTSYAVGHQYLAAAYGGILVFNPTQQALTKQSISGFLGLAGTPLSNSSKNAYAQAGVAITEVDRLGRLVVRQGVTTDVTNINTREISVVRAKDTLITLLQNGIESADLIGTPIDENTPLNVKSVVDGLLAHATDLGTIVGYTGLAVRLVTLDPSQIEVKFAYQPAYPLNYIMVNFNIDMTTGITDLGDQAAAA